MDEAPAQQPQSKNDTNTMNHLEMKITKPVLVFNFSFLFAF
jgi:hypothetical protein